METIKNYIDVKIEEENDIKIYSFLLSKAQFEEQILETMECIVHQTKQDYLVVFVSE